MMYISIQNLCKQFNGNIVLDNLSFSCLSGEIIGFTGYNGCGKTVLLKCICGLYSIDRGSITVGKLKRNKDDNYFCDAGIIIEHPSFLSNETGYKNLLYLYSIQNKPNRNHIRSIMKCVGLDPDLRIRVKNYSLGMKQRLGIAQAIMEGKQLLILDEPFNGLDRQGISDIRNLLLDLKNEGKTILLSGHSGEELNMICDHIYELEHGKLTEKK